VWNSRRDKELVAWLLLLSENGVVPGSLSTLPACDLPLKSDAVDVSEDASPAVTKATALLQMFHSIKHLPREEFVRRLLVLQVKALLLMLCVHAMVYRHRARVFVHAITLNPCVCLALYHRS
jgi:hypothetical protein